MAYKFADRVMEYGEDYGTGATYSFSEALVGFQRITPTFDIGDTFDYVIYRIDSQLAPTGEWESGLATVTGSSEIERTVVHANSAGTEPSRLDFTSGFGNIIIATPTAQALNTIIAGVTGVEEAPNDGSYYARRNEGWSAFTPGGGGGGGGLVKLDQVRIAVATNTVSFASISQDYDDLILVGKSRGTGTGGVTRLQLNGDTGANYDSYRVSRYGTTQSATATSIEVATPPDTGSTAGQPDIFEVLLADYADTTFNKALLASSMIYTAGTNYSRQQTDGWWRNTNAISQIGLALSTGNFAVGSVFTLYGRGG